MSVAFVVVGFAADVPVYRGYRFEPGQEITDRTTKIRWRRAMARTPARRSGELGVVRRIKSGQRLRVDGGRGIISVLGDC